MKAIIQVEFRFRSRDSAREAVREVIGNAVDLPRVTFREGDPILERLFESLRLAGVPCYENMMDRGPYSEEIERAGYYWYQRLHHFEPADYLAAEYLWFHGMGEDQNFMTAQPERVEGQLMIDVKQYPVPLRARRRKYRMWSVDGGPVLVSPDVRDEMEQNLFVGLGFREVLFGAQNKKDWRLPGKLESQADVDRMFELMPPGELAPMIAESVVRRSFSPGQPAPPQRGPGRIMSPDFDDLQPAYRRGELLRNGPFDVARTWEYLTSSLDAESRWLIVSQRFYQCCLKHTELGFFTPVMLINQ